MILKAKLENNFLYFHILNNNKKKNSALTKDTLTIKKLKNYSRKKKYLK